MNERLRWRHEVLSRPISKKGITKEMLDMEDFIGLTASELQSIVDCAKPIEREVTE